VTHITQNARPKYISDELRIWVTNYIYWVRHVTQNCVSPRRLGPPFPTTSYFTDTRTLAGCVQWWRFPRSCQSRRRRKRRQVYRVCIHITWKFIYRECILGVCIHTMCNVYVYIRRYVYIGCVYRVCIHRMCIHRMCIHIMCLYVDRVCIHIYILCVFVYMYT